MKKTRNKIIAFKQCKSCLKVKHFTLFRKNSGLISRRNFCEKCERAKSKVYFVKNKDLIDSKSRAYYEKNREAIIQQKIKNRDKDKYNAYMRSRRSESLHHRINAVMSASINHYVKKKHNSTNKLLPFTIDELGTHLERQFKDGMSWDNYGAHKQNGKRVWHIDHIKPVTSFKFSSIEDPAIQECWSLNNLQPLWAINNFKKGNKYVEKEN